MPHGSHGCHHSFALCRECDVVYCNKCSKEWGNHHQGFNWYPSWSTTSGNLMSAGGTTTSSNAAGNVTIMDSHVHS